MTQIEKILTLAVSQIGVKEIPAGSNKVKYNTAYYGRVVSGSAYPWCCAFIWWLFNECGLSNLFVGGSKTAYCPNVEKFYKSIGQWHSTPKVGDIVLFDFTGKGLAGHIGIVEKVNADGSIVAIEGNTSLTSNDNGGSVMRRTRKRGVIRGFARPQYDGATTSQPQATTKPQATTTSNKGVKTVNVTLNQLSKGDKGKQVKTLQRLLQGFGYSVGSYGIDGDFGNATLTAVKNFQKDNGLTSDGIVGSNTWNKLLK